MSKYLFGFTEKTTEPLDSELMVGGTGAATDYTFRWGNMAIWLKNKLFGSSTVWTSDNDGVGSGLDADTLRNETPATLRNRALQTGDMPGVNTSIDTNPLTDKTITNVQLLAQKVDSNPADYIPQGEIDIAADFPELGTVQAGWLYVITSNVTDNDVLKTNTGQSFLEGVSIVWAASGAWLDLGSNYVTQAQIDKLNLGANFIKTIDLSDPVIGNPFDGAVVIPTEDGPYPNFNNQIKDNEFCVFEYVTSAWVKKTIQTTSSIIHKSPRVQNISEVPIKELITDTDNVLVSGNTYLNEFYKYNFINADIYDYDSSGDKYTSSHVSNKAAFLDSSMIPFNIEYKTIIPLASTNAGLMRFNITDKFCGGLWINKTEFNASGIDLFIQYRTGLNAVLATLGKTFITIALGESYSDTSGGVTTSIVMDEENGDYIHITFKSTGVYTSAELVNVLFYPKLSALNDIHSYYNINCVQGVDLLDSLLMYRNSDSASSSIKEFKAALVDNPIVDSYADSDEIIINTGIRNELDGFDDGVLPSEVEISADVTQTFPDYDGSAAPELSFVDKMMITEATGAPFFNYLVRFPNNRSTWTFGGWFRKADYLGGQFRVHVAWVDVPEVSPVFATDDIDYVDLVAGTSGILSILNFTASYSITDAANDWFFLEVKSGDYDGTRPDLIENSIIPYKTGGTGIGEEYALLHTVLDLRDVVIDPRAEYELTLKTITPANLFGNQNARLVLPKEIKTFVGETVQIFKYNICSAHNPDVYNIEAVASKSDGIDFFGDDYNRYWEFTGAIGDNFDLTFNMFDNRKILIDSKTMNISVSPRQNEPASNVRVMHMGDSLTWYNRIIDEFYRVLTSLDAPTTQADTTSDFTAVMSAGKGFSNVEMIGTQLVSTTGWVGQQKHEGYSGWEWKDFIESGSPFWIGGVLDFNQYLIDNSFTGIDVMYIGLAWNDQAKTMTSTNDASQVIANAKVFLRALHTQLPGTKVKLWWENYPGNVGGSGNHPFGSSTQANTQEWKLRLSAIFEAYSELIKDPEFSPYVDVVAANAMIDSEYGLREDTARVNSRNTLTERRGFDDVHPNDLGMFQIADALTRDFINTFGTV